MNTTATYTEFKALAIHASREAGHVIGTATKTLALYRAGLISKHPKVNTDHDKAKAESFSLIMDNLCIGGLEEKAAKGTANNTRFYLKTAAHVFDTGLSLELFHAIGRVDANKAAAAINEDNIEEVNALPLTKAGKLTKAAKEYLGLLDTKDDDDDDDNDGGDDKTPAQLLAAALIQITNVKHAIEKLDGHDAERFEAMAALSETFNELNS
jgi:hypothetical protein